jgi:hypothetical protein
MAVVDERAGTALAEAVDQVRAAGAYVIGGASRKSVPRGFDRDHKRAEFLLHDGLHASLDAKAGPVVKTPEFLAYCVDHFAAMWPVSKWLLEEVTGKE